MFYHTTLCLVSRTFWWSWPLLKLHCLLQQLFFRYFHWSWSWDFSFHAIILRPRRVCPFCSQNTLFAIFWEFSFPWCFGRFLPLRLKKNYWFWLGVVRDLDRLYRFCHVWNFCHRRLFTDSWFRLWGDDFWTFIWVWGWFFRQVQKVTVFFDPLSRV